MTSGTKKESWLGVLLTAVLCGGFLYWFFKPTPVVWRYESAAQLVERAAAEPPTNDPSQRLVLDLDLLEVAVAQARQGLIDDAMVTAGHIIDPAVQTEAARTVAHAFLHSDPSDLARTLRVADILNEEAGRVSVRSDIVNTLAVLGYPDAAIPEAKTPLQKAALARRIAGKDLQSKARELIAAAEDGLAALSPAEAAPVREELAWAYSNLTLSDGPQKAIDAIKVLPAEKQAALWDDLAGWCAGRPDAADSLGAVTAAISDPAVRLQLETDSLLTNAKLRPAADLETEVRATIAAAASPKSRHIALISLVKIQRNAGLPGAVGAESAATATLKEAASSAANLTEPAARAAAFMEITGLFSDLLLMSDAVHTLGGATAAAREIGDPAARIPVLIDLAQSWHNQARSVENAAMIAEAAALAESGVNDPAALSAAASALVRKGEWPRAALLLTRISDPALRRNACTAVAKEAAEIALFADPAEPPPRGQPVDGIREAASGDEKKAAALVEATEPGYAKARALLAMAKGLHTPPMSMDSYLATGGQPPDNGSGENPKAENPTPEDSAKSE